MLYNPSPELKKLIQLVPPCWQEEFLKRLVAYGKSEGVELKFNRELDRADF